MERLFARKLARPALALLLTAALAACSLAMASMEADPATDMVVFRQRAEPQRAYRVVMEVANPPGLYAVVQGTARYEVVNAEACGRSGAVRGGYERQVSHMPLIWERLSETSYSTTIYVDLMQDEDYFDRGVCRWEFTRADALLSATVGTARATYRPDLSAEQLESERPVLRVFRPGGRAMAPSAAHEDAFARSMADPDAGDGPGAGARRFSVSFMATEARL